MPLPRPNPVLHWRREHTYTQTDISSLSGLTEQTVRRVEQGTITLPVEIEQLIGGSIRYEYDKWRSTCRELAGLAYGETVVAVLASDNPPNNFVNFRCDFLDAIQFPDTVNSMAKLLKIDPRRITEAEKHERPLSLDYRRALLQIGVPASVIKEWEGND